MRGHGAALATIFLLLVIAGVASALPTDPQLGRMSAQGPVSLSSSKNGVALLQGTGIKPGDSVTGLVTLTNKGNRAGKLSLMLSGLRDTPGFYGGRLSSVLQLRIDDLSTGSAPVQTTLARTTPVALADLKGRQTRTYKVTATFPDTGIPAGPALGDNAQQGSSVEIALAWNLSEKDPVAPKPPIPTAPAPAPAPSPVQGDSRPRLVTLRVPAQRVVKPRKLKVWVACELRCKLKFSATIDNAPKRGRMGHKAKRRRTLMSRHVFKGLRVKGHAKKWVTHKRIGGGKRYTLKFTKRGLKRLKRQLRTHHRAGITVKLLMHSVAGNRVVVRRIVVTKRKHGFRGRPAKLR
jgi:hypothetical protein